MDGDVDVDLDDVHDDAHEAGDAGGAVEDVGGDDVGGVDDVDNYVDAEVDDGALRLKMFIVHRPASGKMSYAQLNLGVVSVQVMPSIRHEIVSEIQVFYRESGSPGAASLCFADNQTDRERKEM